jgi:AcrR family transcriptional regulator
MALGRPREFCIDEVLDRALQVFWQHGYEGASVSDLCHAMGINPPSLYAAFGNKEGLFRQVLDRYVAQRAAFWDEALAAPNPRDMVERLLRGTVDFLTAACNPPGCLLVRGALACSDMAQDVHNDLVARRNAAQASLEQRLETAKRAGALPPDLDPGDLARYIATVLDGLSVRAGAGAGREELQRVVDMALRAWPALTDRD